MIESSTVAADPLREALHAVKCAPEAPLVRQAADSIPLDPQARRHVLEHGRALATQARLHRPHLLDLDGWLAEYRLSTPEGVALMCLAEALLRIPDTATIDRLIRDKIGSAHWEEHLGHSGSGLVNASTWALMLGARFTRWEEASPLPLVGRLGDAVMRQALIAAMDLLGRQFVMGRTITEALERSRPWEDRGYGHSFDVLGEAARTRAAAETYMASYADAIAAIGQASQGRGPVLGPGLSVKLSALHPRYDLAQWPQAKGEMTARLLDLCRLARDVNIGLTVDAEEADRLDLSLDPIRAVLDAPDLAGWDGFGLAVQAYQKRARGLVSWLVQAARSRNRRLGVRLVKGAYWDSEIKRAQDRGLEDYPVFTSKSATDLSYLACAADLLAAGDVIRPMFATHNAHTMAAVAELAGARGDWEFQRLHGMGEALYDQMVPDRPCRTYCPVGSHRDLLPYLVRRLLENGANTSFVNRLADAALPVEQVVTDPLDSIPDGPAIVPPPGLFGPERRNSAGLDLAAPPVLDRLRRDLAQTPSSPPVHPAELSPAVRRAEAAFPAWNRTPADERAGILERAADLMEAQRPALMHLAITEAGKTIPDALGEVREAVDFLRFYAGEARRLFAHPTRLPGPVGERNTLSLSGRGVFACISPWNFPLAIFVGQVAAALAAGNTVVAKPAEQTPGMAQAATSLLHRAGIPEDALILVAADRQTGARLVAHAGVAGVAFTGSTATAKAIQRALAERDGPILPLMAETGGVNALIADSSALPEQLVADVLESAFRSAGQRCSALRVLFIQREAWAGFEPLLAGAMAELRLGDPADPATDVGPVIDATALDRLHGHARRLEAEARLVARTPGEERGLLFAPRAFERADLSMPPEEIFGPILQIVPWESGQLGRVLEVIRASGWGLTLGIHSRVETTIARIQADLRVGNVYVNRGMIGAVVGSQPFGGLGLSGTGPKAGGPQTLLRYAVEICSSVNTAAMGGDPDLLSGNIGVKSNG